MIDQKAIGLSEEIEFRLLIGKCRMYELHDKCMSFILSTN